MNSEFTKEWLQWVIYFIQMDIPNLSHGEKNNFFRKFYQFTSFRIFFSIDPSGKNIQLSQNQILELQASAPEIQKIVRQFIDRLITTRANHPLPDFKASIRPGGPRPPLAFGERIYFKLSFHPMVESLKNWALVNLARLLEGIEVGVIGKCGGIGKYGIIEKFEGCQRYFLNFSSREKIYCSPRCASKSTSRLRRERLKRDPKKWEAYQKKQRVASSRSYKEKRAREGKKVRPRPEKRGKRNPAIF